MTPAVTQLLDSRPLSLPSGTSEHELFEWLATVRIDGNAAELQGYLKSDFRRFLYTLGLFCHIDGRQRQALEFGASPYFMTMLGRQFTEFEWTYSNYFGVQQVCGVNSQNVNYRDFSRNHEMTMVLNYHHFNSEADRYPLPDESFDLVLYCEILEHLTNDPCHALRRIRNLIKPGGHLVLTTPNVARAENVTRLLDGANLYDPYSGYGPYGRHNREYTCEELRRLLSYVGFEVEDIFTSDVHPYTQTVKSDGSDLSRLLASRSQDLGQYIFVRARKTGEEGQKLPHWLYRSVPASRIALDDADKVASLSAGISPVNPLRFEWDSRITRSFVVCNKGDVEWDYPDLKMGAKIYTARGDVVREFRGKNVGVVAPGESVELLIDIDLTDLPRETLELVFDLVNEHQFWFENMGSAPVRTLLRAP